MAASFIEAVGSFSCPQCNHAFDAATENPGALLTSVPCPHCGAPLFIPGRIGDFVLVEQIASDGISTVYRATGMTLAHDVAIKIIPSYATATDALRSRLQADVRKATQLDSPHLAKVLALSVASDHFFLVMQRLNGETLAHRLQQAMRLSECEVLRLALDVADGLAALHGCGLVHGSVTPDNIVLDANGIARLAAPSLLGSQRRDVSGGLLGSPLYMAPEVITGRADSACSDIYAFGVTLYHTLTGHHPFAGKTPDAVFKAHLYAVILPIGVHLPTLSATTRELVERMLSRNPYDRFADSRMLSIALHRALAALDPTHQVPEAAVAEDEEPEPDEPSHATLQETHRRLCVLTYALVSVVGVAVVATCLALSPFTKPGKPAAVERKAHVFSGQVVSPAPTSAPLSIRAPATPPSQGASAETIACTQRIHADWQDSTLGRPVQHGSTLWYDETVSISGEGAGIGGTSDSCRFVNVSLECPFVLSLRVVDIATTHPNAKTGILIRSDTTPAAACVFAGFAGNGDLLLQCRRRPGAAMETILTEPAPSDGWSPRYLRLECFKDRVLASASADGDSWEAFGECQIAIAHRSLVGMAVASATTNEMAMAEYADIRLLTPPPRAALRTLMNTVRCAVR